MKATIRLIAALLIATLFAPAANAGWIHQEKSVFRAERGGQKHPKAVDQLLVLPREVTASQLCVAYARNTTVSDTGRVATKVLVTKRDGSTRKFRIVTQVTQNRGINCKNLGDLRSGASIHMGHRFKQMPRFGKTNGEFEQFVVTGMVSTLGQPPYFGSPIVPLPKPEELITPLGLVQGEKSGWLSNAKSLFVPEAGDTKHPSGLDRLIVVHEETGARPLICAGYDRGPEPGGRGRMVTKVRIARANSEKVERFRLAGNLSDGTLLKCKNAKKKLFPGDLVAFFTDFKRMPTVESGIYIDMMKVVSTSGQPQFGVRPEPEPEPKEEEPVEEVEDDPDSGGGSGGGGSGGGSGGSGGGSGGGGGTGSGGGTTPPPPPSGGGLSSADYAAASKIFCGLNQLHNPKGGTLFEVIGPKTYVDANGTIRNLGKGSTIAGALSDYERRFGAVSGCSRSMSSRDRSALAYFARITGGPTGIRTIRSGDFKSDFYRRSTGVQIGGPFKTVEQAVNFMRSFGL